MKRETNRNRLHKGILISCGLICVALGIIGVILPLVPATPFLLLAAACFARSSPALQQWLYQSPLLGKILLRYKSGAGLTRTTKVLILVIIWSSLGPSTLLLIPARLWPIQFLLLLIGLAVSLRIWQLKPRPLTDG